MGTRQDASPGVPARGGTLKGAESLLRGLLIALVVIFTLGIAIAMGDAEQALVARVSPTPGSETVALAALPAPSRSPTSLPAGLSGPWPPSPSATAMPAKVSKLAPLPTSQPAQKPAACVPPANWQVHTVRSGESLRGLARLYGTTADNLLQANCLTGQNLRAGQRIYVPRVAASRACGRPTGWVSYTVQSNDTLFRLSIRFRVSVSALKDANCLVGDIIAAGKTLWVPRQPPGPTRRPAPTATRVPTTKPTTVPEGTSVAPSETPTSETGEPTAVTAEPKPTKAEPKPTKAEPKPTRAEPQPTTAEPEATTLPTAPVEPTAVTVEPTAVPSPAATVIP